MQAIYRYSRWLFVISVIGLLISLVSGITDLSSIFAVASAVSLALALGSYESFKNYQYTAWIIAAIVAGLLYPSAFLQWGNIDLRNPWIILIVVQLVMFGMGTQMSIEDFKGLKTMGRGVFVGLLCQFSIMPIVGFLLTKVFNFEPEIAAGVILIGSCSSGLASNVMVYLAKANLPLSITLTAVATLLAPIMTPFWMKILAGTYVEIVFLDMCFQIIKIVIVPIGAALLYDAYKNGNKQFRRIINIVFVFAALWLLAMAFGWWAKWGAKLSGIHLQLLSLFNFLLGAIVFGVAYYYATTIAPNIQKLMPLFSMFGIIYFTTVTTAASRENILAIGVFLLLASILHNSLGYTLGYWLSRLLGLDKNSCRTVALEVGMQNGGMASGLAGVMGKLATLGLAAAIFSPWMNISGSVLANYWRKKSEQ